MTAQAATRWRARSRWPASNLALYGLGFLLYQLFLSSFQLGLEGHRLDLRIPSAAVCAGVILGTTTRWRVGPSPLGAERCETALWYTLLAYGIILPAFSWLGVVRADRPKPPGCRLRSVEIWAVVLRAEGCLLSARPDAYAPLPRRVLSSEPRGSFRRPTRASA